MNNHGDFETLENQGKGSLREVKVKNHRPPPKARFKALSSVIANLNECSKLQPPSTPLCLVHKGRTTLETVIDMCPLINGDVPVDILLSRLLTSLAPNMDTKNIFLPHNLHALRSTLTFSDPAILGRITRLRKRANCGGIKPSRHVLNLGATMRHGTTDDYHRTLC